MINDTNNKEFIIKGRLSKKPKPMLTLCLTLEHYKTLQGVII